jgi:hypothetical protein
VIRHEVILRIIPDLSREQIDRVLDEVRALLGRIPGVRRVRTGANNTPAYRHALIVVDLEDEAALRRFQRHPLRARAVRLAAGMASSTAVGSYRR